MSDLESDYKSDHESDLDVSESHSKLIEAVAQLDKSQRVKKAERSEPTLEVSEFHLVKSSIANKDAVLIQDLAKSLGKKGYQTEINKKLNSVQKKVKVLSKPLEKPAADRIKRIVGFENTRKELKKWGGLIAQNRVAEKIRFPLKQVSAKPEPSSQFLKRFRITSELEKELAALEPMQENITEEENEYSMTLEEILIRRNEAAKLRAQQSYKEATAHRQRKIKSKKFHKVQRKEKMKQQLKEFEILQKTDPQAALEKLEQLDRTRAEERMSLRHKSTGQWAKNKQVRAKYDKETRQVLAQQLAISRDLTQKVKKSDDSEDEGENEENDMPFISSVNDKDNPWVNGVKTETEINNFIHSYRQYWDGKNKNTKNVIENINCNVSEGTETKKKSTRNLIISNNTDGIINTEIQGNNMTVNETVSKHTNISKNVPKKKTVSKRAGTSSWNVEPVNVENEQIKNVSSTSLKLNEIFDTVEESVQKQIKTKLERIKRKYNIDTEKKDINIKNKNRDQNDSKDDFVNEYEFKSKKVKPVLDEPMNESVTNKHLKPDINVTELKNVISSTSKKSTESNKNISEIDPNKYINVKPVHLKTHLPNITGDGDVLDDSENEEEKHMIISEAFADDDVVEEFRKEKEEEVKKSQPEDIDLSLPGWGSWGGKNVRQSSRKKKRFIIKVPKAAPRKDENKGNLIIIEDDDAKVKQHQVNELPFPFTSVKDFEASIRAPLGRNFVPETAHKKLIEPTVTTDLGKIIEPMDDDMLVDTKNMKKLKEALPKNKMNKRNRVKTVKKNK